jgi:hypothetical protein
LGDDAFKQSGGRFWPGRLQHLYPGGSAPSVGQHDRATGATSQVEVESGLIRGGEGAVECVGEHRFTLGALLRIAGSTQITGLCAAELIEVCHLNHLSL